MVTMKSFTSLEQSKKLAKILPLESADMSWVSCDDGKQKYYQAENRKIVLNYEKKHWIPCWSLAALRNLLPPAIKPNKNTYLFESHNTFDKSWVYRYYNEDNVSYLYCKNTNEVDACVALIEKLYEQKLL